MSKVKTFTYQEKLPRLPIPSLESTFKLYLQSIVPLATPEEYKRVSEQVKDLLKSGGLGPILQNRLLQHDKTQKYSWLESWWLDWAYHTFREPTLINVNWYCIAKPDPNLDVKKAVQPYNKLQLERAAILIDGFISYMERIDKEEIEPELVNKQPICMDQYRQMFGVMRIPQPNKDIIVGGGDRPTRSRHILVLIDNHIFRVPIYQLSSGARLSTGDIMNQLKKVVDLINGLKSKAVPISLFTAAHRDTWADAYNHLIHLNAKNLTNMLVIQESLFVVSLDKIVTSDIKQHQANIYHSQQATNRWLDAPLNLIVDVNGNAGLNGEHSPLDALIPASVLATSNLTSISTITPPTDVQVQEPRLLQFEVDKKIQQLLHKAKEDIKRTIADSDSMVLSYTKFGTDFIKKVGKVSPDAFIQMAMQLTHLTLHKELVGTYETGSTRKFQHGRTDVIRVLSQPSKEFCLAMLDPESNDKERHAKLVLASKAHLSYAHQVSQGLGCDRHMLGLRLCLKEGESHPLFEDPLFKKSSTWRLSTSSMLKTDSVIGTGFGSVAEHGYGINYIPVAKGDSLIFGVESKKSSTYSNTADFLHTLQNCLDSMYATCKAVGSLNLETKARI